MSEAPAAPEPAPKPAAPRPRFVDDFDTFIRVCYPLLYLVSWEEQRLDAILADLAAAHGKVLLSWSITRGLRRIGGARSLPSVDGSKDPVEALQAIGKLSEPSLVILKDFHPYLNDPAVT